MRPTSKYANKKRKSIEERRVLNSIATLHRSTVTLIVTIIVIILKEKLWTLTLLLLLISFNLKVKDKDKVKANNNGKCGKIHNSRQMQSQTI